MIWDISPTIRPRLAVWPGDRRFRREIVSSLGAGDGATSSTLHGTAHLGAHADAPSHVDPQGTSIDAMDLGAYVGPCQVIRARVAPGGAIEPAMLPRPVAAPRVLFATGTYPDPDRFNENFAALSVELIDELHARGVVLVGIDTPGVDLFAARELPVHRRIAQYAMASLEGLVLDAVPPGMYELIALPLRLADGDASPVRAALRDGVGTTPG